MPKHGTATRKRSCPEWVVLPPWPHRQRRSLLRFARYRERV